MNSDDDFDKAINRRWGEELVREKPKLDPQDATIKGVVSFYRQNRKWHMRVEAPRWIIEEIGLEAADADGCVQLREIGKGLFDTILFASMKIEPVDD